MITKGKNMKFLIDIEMGSAAMTSNDDVADVLQILVDRLRFSSVSSGVVRDYNFNRVGTWEVV